MNKTIIKYTALFLILAVTSVLSLMLFFRERSDHDLIDMNKTFPYTVGDWKGEDLKIDKYDYNMLETRNVLLREYTNPQGEMLSFFIVYSETNRSVFHPPEVCLIGSGIAITDKKTESITAGMNKFMTNKLYLEKSDRNEIVLYGYKVGGFYTDKFYLQQALFALNQLFGRHVGGATVRVSMQVRGSEEETTAELKGFLSQAIQIIEKM